MDFGELRPDEPRLMGNYILGPRIGSGSFAVVRKSRHRQSGTVVAIKEIDKKHLNPKVSDNLLKEISILSTINHPNIIRLFEAIQTNDRIYLVLEYCDGGDLAGYIHRHGKVSESVARHFMRQLAAGLKVLQNEHLIHRDLKPQNLLLTSRQETPVLKIGDFGFARSLTPQGLADTLCGSPLYMAPEIIQNQKYDAKADLWSVGAILFQLLTGKHPFDGNNPLQLFQNILKSTELRFPKRSLEELHPDGLDLCRSLLRQNPVERITFKEFFDHKFLQERRSNSIVEEASVSQVAAKDKSKIHIEPVESSSGGIELPADGVNEPRPTFEFKALKKIVDCSQQPPNQIQVSDSVESIEKGYVIVNRDAFCYHLETPVSVYSSRTSHSPLSNDQDLTEMLNKEPVGSTSNLGEGSHHQVSHQFSTSGPTTVLKEVQGLPILHPSTRLQLFRQYVQVLSELSQEKCDAGLFLESLAVELVTLALWQKAVQVCDSWFASVTESKSSHSSFEKNSLPLQKDADSGAKREENVDFNTPSFASKWAEQGFIAAIDYAEKLSQIIQERDGATVMPDAMEIIFQKALAAGRSGAVDEYMENKHNAAASYSKALLLLSFIVGEAESLKLNPPFSLTRADKKRIQHYISNLQTHQTNFLMSQPFQKLSQGSINK